MQPVSTPGGGCEVDLSYLKNNIYPIDEHRPPTTFKIGASAHVPSIELTTTLPDSRRKTPGRPTLISEKENFGAQPTDFVPFTPSFAKKGDGSSKKSSIPSSSGADLGDKSSSVNTSVPESSGHGLSSAGVGKKGQKSKLISMDRFKEFVINANPMRKILSKKKADPKSQKPSTSNQYAITTDSEDEVSTEIPPNVGEDVLFAEQIGLNYDPLVDPDQYAVMGVGRRFYQYGDRHDHTFDCTVPRRVVYSYVSKHQNPCPIVAYEKENEEGPPTYLFYHLIKNEYKKL